MSADPVSAGPASPPLSGMRVLDLSQQLPGPYATYLLAALGASVTKVEPPAGDAARHLDPEMFARVNAGKRSVVLDLKQTDGRTQLADLVREHDVFVEGFRPGVTARLGCDYDAVRSVRPQVVYCSITGMGLTGPLASHPTHDITLQAMAGALPADADIATIGVPWVDLATGTSAALAITAAWHAGGGAHLDLSMLDAAVAWSAAKPSAVGGHREPTYGTLRTRDGAQVVIALLEDSMWQRLCTALGWGDWSGDPRLQHYTDRRDRANDEIRDRLERSVAALDLDEVVALAAEHDLPIQSADAASDATAREQIATRFGPDLRADALSLPPDVTRRLPSAPSLGDASATNDHRNP